jgi:phosphoglycolate phosphatase
MVKKTLRAVFFDLDGTLIDHFAAIRRCFNWTLEKIGREPLSQEKFRRLVGPPLRDTVRAILGSADDGDVANFCEIYSGHMGETFRDGLVELPGAQWILEGLVRSGYALALFTNKQRQFAEKICRAIGLDRYFRAIIATESDANSLKKPDEAYARLALHSLGVSSGEAALVGDSEIDFFAAQAGHFAHSFLLPTGTHNVEELLSVGVPAGSIYSNLWELGKEVFALERPKQS